VAGLLRLAESLGLCRCSAARLDAVARVRAASGHSSSRKCLYFLRATHLRRVGDVIHG
jgi:hypothetical protein